MPAFFEPTAKERELSLVAAGRSRSFGTPGKPKATIWRPPRYLGSKRKHHTALAGDLKMRGMGLGFFQTIFEIHRKGASPEGDSWKEARKLARRKPSRYGTRGNQFLALNRNKGKRYCFFPGKNKGFDRRSAQEPFRKPLSSSFLPIVLLSIYGIIPAEGSGERTPGGFY